MKLFYNDPLNCIEPNAWRFQIFESARSFNKVKHHMTDQKTDPKDPTSEPLDSSPLDSSPLDTSPPDNSFNIRCPRLGHQINFKYCRSENSGLPCFKTLDCWYNYFDVLTHLKDKLSEEEFEKAFVQTGKPKVFSLVDLIDQAKERQTKKDPDKKDPTQKDQAKKDQAQKNQDSTD